MPNEAMQRSWPQVFGCSEFVLVGSEVSTMDDAELPLADPEIEEQVRTMVGGGLSPEEYAARWATRSLAYWLDDYRYRDPTNGKQTEMSSKVTNSSLRAPHGAAQPSR